MKSRLFAAIFASAVLIVALSGLTSAYYYGGYYSYYPYGDSYDSYSYHSSRTSGSGPFLTTKTTDYGKTTEKYWDGRAWVDRTTYVRETRESPNYPSYGPSYGYDYGSNYGYYDQPWYRKYWSYPRYENDYSYYNYGRGYY